MTYKSINPSNFSGGTSLQGFVKDASILDLTAILGKPTHHPDYNPHPCEDKIQVEWLLSYGGKIMTIYCWKWRKAPGFKERIQWHLGGMKHDYDEREAFLAWVEREIAVKRTLAREGIESYPLGI